MAKREIKRSIFARFRNYFIAGIVILIPIGITIYFTIFLRTSKFSHFQDEDIINFFENIDCIYR